MSLKTKDFLKQKCIFCQEDKDTKLSSTPNGMEKIRKTANIKLDDVYNRLNLLSNDDCFYYHVDNECYKGYTHGKSLKRLSSETNIAAKKTKPDENTEEVDNSLQVLVSSQESEKALDTNNLQTDLSSSQNNEVLNNFLLDLSSSQENNKTLDLNFLHLDNSKFQENSEAVIKVQSQTLSSLNNDKADNSKSNENFGDLNNVTFDKANCLLCGNLDNDGDLKLHTLNPGRAIKLYQTSSNLVDDVHCRTSYVKNANEFASHKFKYHNGCLRKYEREFHSKKKNSQYIENQKKQNEAILGVVKKIEEKVINEGRVFSLNDVSKMIQEEYGPEFRFDYRKIKLCLINYFGEKISFVYPKNKRISLLFHGPNISKVIEDYYNRDPISDCVKILNEAFKQINFNLKDKFCDEKNLQLSWENMVIPKPILLFFSKLFTIDINEILKQKFDSENFDDCDDDENDDDESQNIFHKIKALRVKSLIQIVHFIKSSGKVKTPLQTLLGLFTYSATKSKTTITILNRLGLSIGHDAILRIRCQLAEYATITSQSAVPFPSHFNTNSYTTAAFDNFDHNEDTTSGLGSTHDTVSVIFQDFDKNYDKRKPNISETAVNSRTRTFSSLLPCQEIQPFEKLSTVINFSADHVFSKENLNLTVEDYQKDLQKDDFAWFLSRMSILEDKVETTNAKQCIPAWSAFNSVVTEDKRPKQIVAFLPILPFPVTEESTVYTALCTFKNLLSQLSQKNLPVACDEGVYRIARHIILKNEKEFEGIQLFLGNFHIIKNLITCTGKYLKDSGVETIFSESGLFGVHVTESLLKGKHYARAVQGFGYLAEALRRLQLAEFFTPERLKKYDQNVISILMMKECFLSDELSEASDALKEFREHCSELLFEFNDWVKSRCQESEMFNYWNTFLILSSLINDFIRADRTGDYELQEINLKKMQPLFHVMDRTNYAKWGGLFFEDILTLKDSHPEVFEQFSKNGRFTVKRSNTAFSSVATDQALEQTINRSSKVTSGIIGITRKKESVTIFDLTFHEVTAIKNYLKVQTFVNDNDEELKIHRKYSPSATETSELAVDNILTYLKEKNINPFESGSHRLRNVITQELVHSETAQEFLNILSSGIDRYNSFREERFIKKSVPFSEPISKYNLPTFLSVPTDTNLKELQKKTVSTDDSLRIIALANERKYPIEKLLCYELTSKNILFGPDELLKKEENKSSLVKRLEKYFTAEDTQELFNQEFLQNCLELKTCIVIDVMLVLRSITSVKTFEDMAQKFCNLIKNHINTAKATRVDFAFDSYFDKSIKSSERARRRKTECTHYENIYENTPFPNKEKENQFWGSEKNKILLQKFIKTFICRNQSLFPGVQLVFSVVNDSSSSSVNPNIDVFSKILDRHDIEEADLKIMIHIKHLAMHGFENAHILSSDTDVIVLVLYFWSTFQIFGLKTLWVKAGNLKTPRYIPIHLLSTRLGEDLCSTLPALHHLTGADYTSKVGTKLAALKANPTKYLLKFGTDSSKTTMDKNIDQAEKYLVQVFKHNSLCKNFNELRLWYYLHEKPRLLRDLPPTSASIQLHILRAYYVVNQQVKCLDPNQTKLDPTLFGFKEEDDLLLPEKINVLLPPFTELVPNCKCKVCKSSKTCYCVAAGITCCSFCFCKKTDTCKNKYANYELDVSNWEFTQEESMME